MGCTDPLLAALKDVGYNVVRLPRADIAPLQILARKRSNLDPLGSLERLIVGAAAPKPNLDEPITTVKGQVTRTSSLDATLGLGIPGLDRLGDEREVGRRDGRLQGCRLAHDRVPRRPTRLDRHR